jgi:hypothetical protein
VLARVETHGSGGSGDGREERQWSVCERASGWHRR